MKIVCISDTHSNHELIYKENKLPEGDIIIHSGDFTRYGSESQTEQFCTWYGALNYDRKILIAGNHDFFCEKHPTEIEKLCKKHGIIYLNDSGYTYKGLKIWGSPIQPQFGQYAFNRVRGADIKCHWDLIPNNVDILITHGPPYNILDYTLGTHFNPPQPAGCEELIKVIQKIRPVMHVFGHIHEGRGVYVDKTEGKPPITHINAAMCTRYLTLWDEDAMVFEWKDLINGTVQSYSAIDK